MTLLEAGFPFRDVSRLVAADRRAPDPVYQAHRWWARRPPALVRAALLAATCASETTGAEFWRAYRSNEQPMAGLGVLDPFLGGGTTLVEAARLGARASGVDVDPLAVAISEHQLQPPAPEDLRAAAVRLTDHLRTSLGGLWPRSSHPVSGSWTPLHYFFVAQVDCPACAASGPLYRSLVLARSVGRVGAVVRDEAVTAFCPDCYALHHLSADASSFLCCGQERALTSSTFKTRYECPGCGVRSSHEQLQTGSARRVLVAVEETPARQSKGGRRLRSPRASDKSGITRASRLVADGGVRDVLAYPLTSGPADGRPLSFGMRTLDSLHTDRQLLYLSEAFRWIEDARQPEGQSDGLAGGLSDDVARALRLAVSTTITCNNRLCGYATDYGRLAPLFSVRAFSLPWLTVELNPLHPSSGRGSLANAVNRVVESCGEGVRRHVIAGERNVVAKTMMLGRAGRGHRVRVADSTNAPKIDETGLADVCLTDPPYFDFIPYDTLSQVFRLWTEESALGGASLHPVGADRVAGFGRSLGAAFRSAMEACKPEALLTFTYKGDSDAWEAVGVALDEAKLRVTALWPVLADPHMGHHSAAGNCEYDVLVVARPVAYTTPATSTFDAASMLTELRRDRPVSKADEQNLRTAGSMGAARWGTVV